MAYITTQDRIARQIDALASSAEGISFVHHFDYPETVSYVGNAAVVQSGQRLGKGCLYLPDTNSKVVITNSTGIFNINSQGSYEIETFVKFSELDWDALGYKFYGWHTFKLFSEALTWSEAKAACEALGGHLATSTSAEKNSFLTSLISDTVWLGGTDEAEEGTWLWVTAEEWSYTNWNSGEPNNSGSNEHYLAILKSGKWNDEAATATHGYICEWDRDFREDSSSILCFGDLSLSLSNDTVKLSNNALNVTHNSEYKFYGGHTFKYFSTALNWANAKATCSALGGHLATAKDIDTYNFICEYLQTLTTDKVRIDGTVQSEKTNNIKLYNGDIIDISTYPKADDWRYDEGATSVGIVISSRKLENCMDSDDYTYSYICEWDFDVSADDFVPATSMHLASTTFNLERSKPMLVDSSGYSFYGGHTFKYFSNGLYWGQAKAACEYLGGHLATSTSSEKNAFLMSLSNNNVIHLGCSYNSETWQWITGEEWSYTNWTENYPSDADTNPQGYINAGGEWMNGSSAYWGYVCEWDFDIRDLSSYDNSTWFDTWHHILLRLSDTYLTLFIDGSLVLKDYISLQKVLAPAQIELGGFVGCLDEFAFRRNAGNGAPTIPEYPYNTTIIQQGGSEDSSSTQANTVRAPVTRVAWTAENLPAGVTLSESGLLSGRPTTTGTYNASMSVSTNWGTDTKTLRITVI